MEYGVNVEVEKVNMSANSFSLYKQFWKNDSNEKT